MNEFTEILNLFIANVIAYTFFVAVYGFIIYNVGKIILYLIRYAVYHIRLQKTYTTDFLNKTRVKNNGLMPQYYVEDNHEAIIPKEIYLQVQEELVRRRVVKTSANGKTVSYTHLTLPTKA